MEAAKATFNMSATAQVTAPASPDKSDQDKLDGHAWQLLVVGVRQLGKSCRAGWDRPTHQGVYGICMDLHGFASIDSYLRCWMMLALQRDFRVFYGTCTPFCLSKPFCAHDTCTVQSDKNEDQVCCNFPVLFRMCHGRDMIYFPTKGDGHRTINLA